MADKPGGFGSIPGDLFDDLIKYFELTTSLSAALEPFRKTVLARIARTEHAAANAEKDAYAVDVVFKCISLQAHFVTAQDTSLNDTVRGQAMTNIIGALDSLKTLWE